MYNIGMESGSLERIIERQAVEIAWLTLAMRRALPNVADRRKLICRDESCLVSMRRQHRLLKVGESMTYQKERDQRVEKRGKVSV